MVFHHFIFCYKVVKNGLFLLVQCVKRTLNSLKCSKSMMTAVERPSDPLIVKSSSQFARFRSHNGSMSSQVGKVYHFKEITNSMSAQSSDCQHDAISEIDSCRPLHFFHDKTECLRSIHFLLLSTDSLKFYK